MKVNLISPKGERVSIKVTGIFFFNRGRVKSMIENGYTLAGEEDAKLVSDLKIF